MRFPVFSHPHQHLLLSVFLIVALLVGVSWYLIVGLICISLMINDFEHLFMGSLPKGTFYPLLMKIYMEEVYDTYSWELQWSGSSAEPLCSLTPLLRGQGILVGEVMAKMSPRGLVTISQAKIEEEPDPGRL